LFLPSKFVIRKSAVRYSKESETELIEAIKSRKSVRAFKPEPVSTGTLKEVLKIATRAPSSVNSQPWEFFIVKGETLDKLKTKCVEQLRQGIKPRPDVPLPDKEKGDMGLQGIYANGR
jgi:predicted oxidoreductase (fatty acid repression mutant protein)